jgi:predicted ester cyclase
MEQIIQKESMTELSRKGTCIEFFSAYQELEIDRMLGLCETNGDVNFIPLGDNGKGKIHEFGKDLWNSLMECFPDLDNTTDTLITDGDNVLCKVAINGTQAKDFAGIPTKGKRFESDHIFIFHFNEEDKIDNISIDWNHQGFVEQLTH